MKKAIKNVFGAMLVAFIWVGLSMLISAIESCRWF